MQTSTIRDLPDPHLSLRDATDFVFDSLLARRALTDPEPRNLAILIREVVTLIYRLTTSCQMPEFTEHGLPHLCSLLDRVSHWTLKTPTSQGHFLIDQLTSTEAGQLLLAILIHDIGMLSQRPEDMPSGEEIWQTKSLRDVPYWVRATHVARLPKLLHRALKGTPLAPTLHDPLIDEAMRIAQAHGSWPWDKGFNGLGPRASALSAIVAIADLLDEDSNRCDIETLLNHRQGTHLNCAHWLRHGLTADRVLIREGRIAVELLAPPDTGNKLAPVFAGLRNHFRLALVYRDTLKPLAADALDVDFSPVDGCPTAPSSELQGWNVVPGFTSESALLYHLLSTFMPLGLLDSKRVVATEIARVTRFGMENVDLDDFYLIRGESEPRSGDEQVFRALTP